MYYIRNLFKVIFCFLFFSTINLNEASGQVTEHISENDGQSLEYSPDLLIVFPEGCNQPNGAALDKNGNIIMTMHNFNSNYLIKVGDLSVPDPIKIIKIDTENNVDDWYVFKESDKNVETGKINPKDCDFGPDDNLYITDGHGRLLRINVQDGEAIDMDVLVEGFNFANGLVWNDTILFVSESIIVRQKTSENDTVGSYVLSGVYAFTLNELQNGLINLTVFSEEGNDVHLVETFKSAGIGADGLAIDKDGSLYTAIFSDGIIYKTQLDASYSVIKTNQFTPNDKMHSADGIVYDPLSKQIFVADLVDNAIHSVDMKGNVTMLHKNGNSDGSDGSLEAPVDVVIRGRELVVLNWDGGFGVNETPDKPFTISVINLQ